MATATRELPIQRFADPEATDTVTLPGPCTCPGSPHGQDAAIIRTQLGGGERQSIATAGWGRGTGGYYDYEAAESELVAVATVSWTLLAGPCTHPDKQHEQGEPVPITFDVVHRRLDAVTRRALAQAINAAHSDQVRAEVARLPNASGARSRESSPASASPTPKPRTKRSRTTPSSSPGAG